MKQEYEVATLWAQEKFIKCLEKLNCSYELVRGDRSLVYEDEVGEPSVKTEVEVAGSSGESEKKLEHDTVVSNLESKQEERNRPEQTLQTNTNTMANENMEFLNMARTIVSSDYKGEALELESFINKVEMLQQLSTPAQLPLMLTFVKSKLSGRALESIKPTDVSIALLIKSLRERIKPESSDVILGKMTALRLSNKSLQEFSKQAEELAESFKRSLIVEGFPENKAHEMTIRKTVEICREAAPSDIVKSVLAASQFTTTQDVVAKFVTETDTVRTEKQVLAFRRNNQNNRGNYRGNQFTRFNNNRGSYHNNNRGRWNNNQNWGNNGYQNNGYQNNQNDRGNYRGNGRWRGRGNRGYQNNGYRGRNDPNVRTFGQEDNSGNAGGPSQPRTGA